MINTLGPGGLGTVNGALLVAVAAVDTPATTIGDPADLLHIHIDHVAGPASNDLGVDCLSFLDEVADLCPSMTVPSACWIRTQCWPAAMPIFASMVNFRVGRVQETDRPPGGTAAVDAGWWRHDAGADRPHGETVSANGCLRARSHSPQGGLREPLRWCDSKRRSTTFSCHRTRTHHAPQTEIKNLAPLARGSGISGEVAAERCGHEFCSRPESGALEQSGQPSFHPFFAGAQDGGEL